MKFTKLPETAFQELQLNAGVLLKSFSPETGAVTDTDILGATTGGVSFSAVPSFLDMGEDMDNCPKNMMELKQLETWEVKMSGTYVTVNGAQVRSLLGAADAADTGKITPERSDRRGLFRAVVGGGLLRQKRSGERRLCGHPHEQRAVHRRLSDQEWGQGQGPVRL